jgi:hypothetical protein
MRDLGIAIVTGAGLDSALPPRLGAARTATGRRMATRVETRILGIRGSKRLGCLFGCLKYCQVGVD